MNTRRRHRAYLFGASIVALFFALLTTTNAWAASVTINDQAGVLDAGRVRTSAANLKDAVAIYTTRTFTGDQNALDRDANQHVANQKMIVIEIDAVQRHLSIQSGSSSGINDSQASDAVNAFRNSFNGGDYTGATIAALNSLQGALSGQSGGINLAGIFVAIILGAGLLVVILYAIVRHRTRGGGPPYGGGRRRGWNNGFFGGYYGGGTHSGGGGFGGGAGGGFGGGGGGGGGAGGSF